MIIRENCVVSLHYTLTDEEGDELDSSAGQEPLVYLHGSRNIIPGLERALTGRQAGDEFEVTIQPEDAYGIVREELIQSVPREAFAGFDDLQVGMQFQTEGSDDQSGLNIIVREIGDDMVVIDANHPLAGQVLHFDVRIEDVREATADEVAHGHAHGAHTHD
jgi:FKBP-type peptidyl-prolyl cis-trans isomerase SlyD